MAEFLRVRQVSLLLTHPVLYTNGGNIFQYMHCLADVDPYQHGELLRVRRGLLVHLSTDHPGTGQVHVALAPPGGGAKLRAHRVAVHGREEPAREDN